MTFGEQLNEYIALLRCSAKDLAASSGLSAAVISRYRSGERNPDQGSEQVAKLATGIAEIAEGRCIEGLSRESILSTLDGILGRSSEDYDRMVNNFNALVSVFDINLTELAHALNFDASYLSRIRLRQRHPSDIDSFVEGVASFVARRYARQSDREAVAGLIGRTVGSLENDGAYQRSLCQWLRAGENESVNLAEDFLRKLDVFDLNEYIRSIHFDELKVPSMPFQLPTSKTYRGLEEMKQGEIDFIKTTVLSKSDERVFICSDMPIDDMIVDVDFWKKWMLGLALVLKKGLHLDMVHDLDRSFDEMMAGLEGWIPLYMTGQISPYYLKGSRDSVYRHLDHVSGEVALTGEAIEGNHDAGKYYLTKKREEVTYYRQRCDCILKKAQPLMDIYREDSKNVLRTFLEVDSGLAGNRRRILSGLPLHTIGDDCLTRILKRNGASETEAESIRAYVSEHRVLIGRIMESSMITDDVPLLSEDEFERYPVSMSLSGMFHEADVLYDYETYREHLQATQDFAAAHANYRVRAAGGQPFRNIQITIREGKWVMVSKMRSPVIHFVIRHPKLRAAMENMVIPVVEYW